MGVLRAALFSVWFELRVRLKGLTCCATFGKSPVVVLRFFRSHNRSMFTFMSFLFPNFKKLRILFYPRDRTNLKKQ